MAFPTFQKAISFIYVDTYWLMPVVVNPHLISLLEGEKLVEFIDKLYLGRCMVKVLPLPGALVTETWPPWA
jgi:hypothetical protein